MKRLLRWYSRSLRVSLIFFFVLGFLFLSPWGVEWLTQGIAAFAPADSGETTEAIVVLGRGEDLRISRTAVVHQLWEAQRAPRIFASGMSDAQEILDWLEEAGVPREDMQGERCSQTTEENALFTNAILYPQGIRTILLVTDRPHLLRSSLMLNRLGFKVMAYPSPLPSTHHHFQRLHQVLREYAALIDYALHQRFRWRSLTELNHPESEVLWKLQDWQCGIGINPIDN